MKTSVIMVLFSTSESGYW